MPREPGAHISRYETIIATLVGVSALFVSGYTAYVQRQQVRAAVWPILQYDSSNAPYCSTLGDCWTVHSSANDNPTVETHLS